MQTDEIYRCIGYIVVIIFGLYVVSKSIRFQTGMLVEGMTAAQRRANNSKSDDTSSSSKSSSSKSSSSKSKRPDKCGDNKSKTKKDTDEKIKKYVDTINKQNQTLIDLNCLAYDDNVNQGLLENKDIFTGINIGYDEMIHQLKSYAQGHASALIMGIQGIDVSDEEKVSDIITKSISTRVENVKTMEACKQYFNELYG
jgi:hypothetical protein